MIGRGDRVSNIQTCVPTVAHMAKTIDEETGSTVSFQEVAFRRVVPPSDDKSLVLQQDTQDTTTPDVLYVLHYTGAGGKIINTRESDTPFKEIPDYGADEGESTSKRAVEPVIEIVTKVSSGTRGRSPRRIRHPPPVRNFDDDDDFLSSSSDSEDDNASDKPTRVERTRMIIHSQNLINALRAIVSYYPDLNLLGETVKIDAPYRAVVHHREALSRYKFHQPAHHSSDYARVTAEHIDILLNFIEQILGDSIRKEEERYARNIPVATFDNYWMALKPGEVIYANNEDVWQPHIVSTLSQEATSDGYRRQWLVSCWLLELANSKIVRKMFQYRLPSWTGEQVIHSLDVMPARFFPGDPEKMLQKQIKLGKLYWELLQRPTYMEYDGLLVQSPNSRIGPAFREPSGYMTGRVICDADGYPRFAMRSPENQNRHSRNGPRLPPVPINQGPPPAQDHLPYFLPRCGCDVCNAAKFENEPGPFAAFIKVSPKKSAPPTSDLFYIACTKVIPAFLLGERRWGHLNLECLKPVVTDRDAFKYLVLDDEIKMTVKALIGKFAASDSGSVSPWGNDFVKNKGEGRIFLLHGAPGVGKTCTAECVAELTNRPLISLTSGDLSVHSDSVENNLSYFLELGQRFGALVLLDEADVYLERRRAKDIARNGLVSVFLRALEYYRGVLFLTTNRVQAFDAAFTSRIHVALHYKNLSDLDRERIWANNFERLDRDSNGRVRVSVATRDYAYESRDVRSLRWNGREIRNALQTALALAESDAADEGSEKITVMDKHLRAVVKMSRGFRDYLRSGSVYDGESELGIEDEEEEEEIYSD